MKKGKRKKVTISKTKTLLASKEIMERAAADKIKENVISYRKHFDHNIYYQVHKVKNILKVAVYQTETLKCGGRIPCHEVYLDIKNFKYKTWDFIKEKWSSATLEYLVYRADYLRASYYWISESDRAVIKECLNIPETFSEDPQVMITYWQRNIQHKKRKQEMAEEVRPWDKAMKKVKPLPKDFEEWLMKFAIKEHFIFYEYDKKGVKEGYCSRCKHTVSIKAPKHNKKGICPHCKTPITYRSIGKSGYMTTDYTNAYLFQKYEDRIVLREFFVYAIYWKGKHKEPKVNVNEYRRLFFDTEGNEIEHYWYGMYRNDHARWQKCPLYSYDVSRYCYRWYGKPGRTYQRNLSSFKGTFLEKLGFLELNKREPFFEPEYYLFAVKQVPLIERLVKADLTALAVDYMKYEWKSSFEFADAHSLAKNLLIDNARLKRLREMQGGVKELEWLRYEKSNDRVIETDIITYFARHDIKPEQLKLLRKHMKERKIMNFLKRQMKLNPKLSIRDILRTYEDYYYISLGVKRNMDLEVFYNPKDLKKEHDAVVALSKGKDIAKRAGEILTMFPNVENVCKSIKEKYEYQDEKEGYAIIVPESVEDIIVEGRTLRHCVDSYDAYFDRIQRQETYIMFLRKMDAIDTPYYTLEIEPGGSARQKRTTNDNQNDDIQQAQAFIRKWQKHIQKNMTAEDLMLARRSRMLREKGFKEMRSERLIIKNGKLKGQLLADVLEADLMEVMCG